MAKKRSRMADVLLGGPDSYREPYHIRRIREREEREARAGMPTSGTKGVSLIESEISLLKNWTLNLCLQKKEKKRAGQNKAGVDQLEQAKSLLRLQLLKDPLE